MITFENISKNLGGKQVLDNISFRIENKELAVLIGNSGSGKTTILRLIAGTLQPDSGTVTINSKRIGFVFQDHRLLPWKTALENVALVIRAQGIDHETARKKAASWLDIVELGDYKNYYPGQLSGGMVQRVSIARAFAIEPDLILMDEPFSSLDEQRSDSLIDLLQRVLKNYMATVLYVTHDFMEAVRLAERLFYLDAEDLLEIPILNRREMLEGYYISRINNVPKLPEKKPRFFGWP